MSDFKFCEACESGYDCALAKKCAKPLAQASGSVSWEGVARSLVAAIERCENMHMESNRLSIYARESSGLNYALCQFNQLSSPN